jgi:hypothetical protein
VRTQSECGGRAGRYAPALVVTTGEGVSTLEHLAEMDRLLRDIQLELDPDRAPAPPLEATTPEAPSPPEPGTTTPEAQPPTDPGTTAPGPETAPAPPRGEPDSGASSPIGAERTAPGPVPPPEPEPSGPDPQLQALSQLAARLVASMRELLDGYEQFLVRLPLAPALPRPSATRPSATRPSATARARASAGREAPDVTVAAGPFASLDALRAFELAVSRLPGVRDVAVRGYEGADRAIIEVRLEQV